MFDFLFGSGRETNYQDALRSAQDTARAGANATNYYYDNIDGKWDDMSLSDRASMAGEYGQMQGSASQMRQGHDDYLGAFDQENKDRRYNYFGNGLIGDILNPIGQTASAAKDLVTGQYAANDRDVMSDVGAAAGTALTALPFAGGMMRGLGAANAGAKASRAINSIPGMAVTGAGFGVADSMRRGGEDTDWGEAAGQAGIGAGLGAAIPIAGRFLGGIGRKRGSSVLTRDMERRGMGSDAIQSALEATPNKALYSTALRSMVPQSTLGRGAAIGGGLFAANQLMGGLGGEPQVPQNPAVQAGGNFAGQYGYQPSEEELLRYMQEQHFLAGGM